MTTLTGVELLRSMPGTIRKLSRRLAISTQAIYKWRVIPDDRVLEVEQVTGIPREQLRPDVYGKSARR